MNNLRRQEHSFESPIHFFDLAETIQQLKDEHLPQGGIRNAVTVAKTPTLSTVLMLLPEGSSVPEHHTAGARSILVLNGLIDFVSSHRKTHLKTGAFVALGEGVSHELFAVEESVLLLSIVPKDLFEAERAE